MSHLQFTVYWSPHFQLANNMATVGRGWKVDACINNMEHGRLDSILFSYLVQGDDFFVPNLSKNTGSGVPLTRQSEDGQGKDEDINDDIHNRLHNNIFCRLRQLLTTASGWRRCWRTGAWRMRSGWRSWRTLKTTTFKIVFTTILSAGCDSCGRQRADEEGAREQEPGGREADGATGGR